ncbi:interleukin-12 receptor subunit beta-2 isoform X1 [Syngnathus typhle]|uniref:interleukin-12 receptor subunit beta-2 isoform X1 n=1 Tax=Syngnathus typhle TaxID=161592 RepID=UPI002A6A4C5C|nr:interleukin-12 receptor subunit beta-2 isoform X1 [Syngnathus typhle]
MAAIPTIWSWLFAVLLVLPLRLGTGELSSCVIWSSPGPVVRRGSSLEVYCAFRCGCGRSMYSGHPPSLQRHTVVNHNTTYIQVENITKDQTFSCLCTCLDLDPCGLDISAGYPPETPRNIYCNYTVLSEQMGEMFCSWEKGRETHLEDTSELRVSSDSKSWGPIKIKGSAPPSARFTLPNGVRFISAQVTTHNALGSAMSLPANYTLSNIVTPAAPVLRVPRCTSRGCTIRIQQPVKTQHLEVQYATETGLWTTDPNSQNMTVALDQLFSISSLEPYQWYQFRARAKFRTGLWSSWSNVTSSWTQEEAPAKELDVWYTRHPFDFESIRLFWKPMTVSHARGKIVAYLVSVHNSQSVLVFTSNLSANATDTSVTFCAECHVTVSALNSKGMSPPAKILAYRAKASAHLDVEVKAQDRGVALWWRQPEMAASYVVEWYPEGLKLHELQWLRLAGEDHHAIITGLNASECYEGAVYVLYTDGSMAWRTFRLFNTSQSVPKVGPSVKWEADATRVNLTWAELPRAQRSGCITQYTIYLEDSHGLVQQYSVQATKRTFVLVDLPVGPHNLWMTAWTSQGEGPASLKIPFNIQAVDGIPVFPLVLCLLLTVLVPLLLCLCQIGAVKKRAWLLFQCFMLQVVPDPANSKWAKEYDQGKSKMHAQQSQTVLTEEEEPIVVIITDPEEVPNHNTEEVDSLPTSPSTPGQSFPTYIKSYSHKSDGSEQTQTSLDTETEQEEQFSEEEDDGLYKTEEELPTIGKLTLDLVRIDWSLSENC